MLCENARTAPGHIETSPHEKVCTQAQGFAASPDATGVSHTSSKVMHVANPSSRPTCLSLLPLCSSLVLPCAWLGDGCNDYLVFRAQHRVTTVQTPSSGTTSISHADAAWHQHRSQSAPEASEGAAGGNSTTSAAARTDAIVPACAACPPAAASSPWVRPLHESSLDLVLSANVLCLRASPAS